MSAPNRSLWFLLGLILGVLLGMGFFYLNHFLTKENTPESYEDALTVQESDSSKENKIKTIKSNTADKDTLKKPMNSAEVLSKKHSREISVGKVVAEADSLLKDTLLRGTTDNFIVRKDKMLKTRNLAVINLGETEQTNTTADSLLEKISGIKDRKTNTGVLFNVEFWQSPINYKGYKMTKNKMILFGVNPEETLTLFHNNGDDALYLKQKQNYFRLYYTDIFRQFEKVNDLTVIEKLR